MRCSCCWIRDKALHPSISSLQKSSKIEEKKIPKSYMKTYSQKKLCMRHVQAFTDGDEPISNWGGGATCYLAIFFYEQLHENERIWNARGGGGRRPQIKLWGIKHNRHCELLNFPKGGFVINIYVEITTPSKSHWRCL